MSKVKWLLQSGGSGIRTSPLKPVAIGQFSCSRMFWEVPQSGGGVFSLSLILLILAVRYISDFLS